MLFTTITGCRDGKKIKGCSGTHKNWLFKNYNDDIFYVPKAQLCETPPLIPSGFVLLPCPVDLLVKCHGESHAEQLETEKHSS